MAKKGKCKLNVLLRTVSFRLIAPVILTYIFVELYFYTDSHGVFSDFTSASATELAIWQIFYSLVATLYAICVAFLLIKEMQDFAELKASFKKEGFIIKSNIMYLYYIEEDVFDKNSGLSEKRRTKRIEVIKSIKDNLKKYLVHLLEYDLHGKNNGVDSEVYIWECVKEIAKIKPLDGNDQIALSRIMAKLEEMFLIRSTRSGWIETGLSPYLLVFITLLSLVIVFPFYTFSSINPMINYVSLGTLVFFLSFLLVTLIDVGNPYSGYWVIPTEMFEEILEYELQNIE